VQETTPTHALAAHEARPLEPIRLARYPSGVEPELSRELGDGRRPVRLEVHAREQATLTVGAKDRKELGRWRSHTDYSSAHPDG
jgi:hypothetical protein